MGGSMSLAMDLVSATYAHHPARGRTAFIGWTLAIQCYGEAFLKYTAAGSKVSMKPKREITLGLERVCCTASH